MSERAIEAMRVLENALKSAQGDAWAQLAALSAGQLTEIVEAFKPLIPSDYDGPEPDPADEYAQALDRKCRP